MTASRGIHRPTCEPTAEWMKSQTVAVPCPMPVLAGDCWIWRRAKTVDGYGRISIHGRDVVAHRAMFEIVNGPVACWLTLDHLCRNRACINPAHQEPVTQQVNIERGFSPSAVAHREMVCQRGHPLTPSSGRMRCKVCLAARQRDWYARHRKSSAPSKSEAS